MNNGDEQARRDFALNQQARMREAHEFRTSQERQAYNDRIAAERKRVEDEQRKKKGW